KFFLFDGTTGSTAHNGTIVGSPTFPAGKFNQGLAGITTSNLITMPSGTCRYTATGFTIEAQLKTTATAIQVGASCGETPGDPTEWIGILANGHFAGAATGSGALTGILDSGIAINDGNFHHCAMVYTAGTLTLFVDGVEATPTLSGVADSLIDTTGNIGRLQGTSAWSGEVDEVALWNFARYTSNFTPPTAAYIGNEPGLIALYHVDGNALDSSFSGQAMRLAVDANGNTAIGYQTPYPTN